MSVIYKERERERDWETTSSRGGGGGYTTVRRYKIPDRSLEEEDVYESEMKVVHRGGRNDFEERRSTKEFKEFDDRRSTKDFMEFDERRSTKDYVTERDDKSVRQVREYRYVDRSPSPRGRDRDRDLREYRIQREYERETSPETVEEIRISRDYEREREREYPREQPYELERYSRSTEYFRPEQPQQSQPIIIRNEAPHIPQAPQPIIIREDPIIIREEAPQPQTIIIREREPAYELVERTEVTEDRQVARPRREREREEDDYYYERKIKEVDRGGRHQDRFVEEREYGHDRFRERDRVGERDRFGERDRWGERDYYSDDDVVRIHKEKDTWGGSDIHAKRDIAAGALAGVAAGQIVRHHRKRKGESAGGNLGNALGYGTLGAVSAVALDKFNNRDRSRSLSSERGRGRRDRDRSRHRSKSRVKELGALAAIAGIGALAYAAGRSTNKKDTVTITEKHRHRSHSRRGRRRSKSVTVIESDVDRSRSRSKHRHSKHHDDHKAAKVGLASAAVAGLVERHRSKSRKREGKRPHSRIREGADIAAAGVAGAAITGLYEKHKAKKEDRASRSRSRSKSRSRSRSVLSRLTGRSRSRGGSTKDEPVLVEYGGDPIYVDPSSRRRSRHRHRRSSSSSSGRRRGSRSRSRSKSRARSAAETAAVAGVAGLAAVEASKRRDRKKAEKERERERRREEDSAYSTGTYSPDYSPQASHAQPHDGRQFPEGNYFPPPPTAPVENNHHHNGYPPYNPSEYPAGAQPNYGPGGYVQPPHEDVNLGNPYAPQYQQNDMHYNQQRRHDDHVSATAPTNPGNEHMAFASARGGSRPLPGHVDEYHINSVTDNVDELDEPSPVLTREKTVQFDLVPQGPSRKSSPESQKGDDDGTQRRARRSSRDKDRHHRHDSPSSDASDQTIELPARFDEHGRKRPHDPMADRLESVLQTLFR